MAFGIDTTVNGVTFNQVTTYEPSNPTISWSSVPNITFNGLNPNANGLNSHGPVGPSSSYASLMTQGVFNDVTGASSPFWTFSGLTINQQYEVQFFAPYWNNTFEMRFSDGTNSSGLVETGNTNAATQPEFLLGTFTANATSQNVFVDPSPQYSFVGATQLRAVPEPSTWALILGGVGLMAFRFVRRASVKI
jgi:hypothetical protein